jgi:hypothetical protein
MGYFQLIMKYSKLYNFDQQYYQKGYKNVAGLDEVGRGS